MSYLDIAKAHILVDEGRRKFPYVDTVGKITVGIGYNLTDRGLPDAVIDSLFAADLTRSDDVCREVLPAFDQLTDNRRAALIDLAFDLDHKIAEFTQMLGAIAQGDYGRAAAELLNSTFARQTGARAQRLAQMMRDG